MSTGICNKRTGYHNRRSIRLPGYDYSRPGYYFVTVCIHDRNLNLFGDVTNATMVLNESGAIVQRCWRDIPNHFPYARLDDFVVMPNHVHGIIRICDVPVGANNHSPHTPQNGDGSIIGANKHSPLRMKPNPPCGTSKTIGSIVRGFKIGVTKLIRKQISGIAVWQRDYFEHIIRDENSLYRIRKYILENPAHWYDDHENHVDNDILYFENNKETAPCR